MKNKLILLFLILIFGASFTKAQDNAIRPHFIGNGVFLGETQPLKEIPPATAEEVEFLKDKAFKKAAAKVYKPRLYPYAESALPIGEDAVWQKSMSTSTASKAPVVNFEGQTTSSFPPDCNGTIGPNHYMQTINLTYAIYNKSGTLLAGPTNMNQLFNGVSGSTCNDGDPLIQYDEIAQRWVAVEFSLCGANDLMLMAVSATNDPTGTWYAYSFDVADMPDYEKLGIWQDGYYMGTNTGSGNDIYVFEKSVMMAGGTNPKMVAFDNPWRPGTGFLCVPPLDNDGAYAPTGTPGLFIAFNDDAVSGGTDQLWMYELDVDWTTTSNTTFTRVQQINVSAFNSQFQASWNDITQPNSQKLDAVPQVIMNAPQYRNFGTYQTIVCCHTVDVDNTDHAGIRWYELRKTPPATTWVIRQQGTFAPDAHSRWMGSIMLNGSGKLGLAYSISSSTVYPGIRYCGQSSGAYANATGILDVPEEIIHTGTVAQTSYNRWGDYALLSIDPNDDETFWFTSEYVKTGGTTKGTKIASFKIGNAPVAITSAATNISVPTATLNGIVNPNGMATTYYFEWGTSVAYGNSTTVTSAGTGTSNVAVNANITGIIAGTTYHFRLVATNADGTTYGSNLTFTPGAATLTTASISAITTTSATSGGNVLTDGGSPVTARGICWGLSSNPTLSNSFTTNGSGTGSFASNMTGLSANTTYHVRAYATNANGTFYGDNFTFTTLCSIFTLPFSESFSTAQLPNCWTIVDNQGSGQNWQFGTITGQSPNPILNGNYTFLNSDAYGSGSSQNSDLVSPTLNLTSFGTINLQFNYYFKSYSGSSGNLYYSINNGSTWTLISSFTTTSSTNPVLFNQPVNAVAGQSQVKFKWNYTGSYGYYWAIDDISITGTAINLPVVSTTAISSITMTSATSGGNVTSAGSSGVTARGICWGTSVNPTLSNNFTTNGSGVGAFTSNISGLTSNTTYHVRAYATNSSGTGYGDDIVFTTACGSISSFPWNEGFENGGTIPNCWSQEQVNNSGIFWTFITGNGSANPANAHTGTYNACLKDNSSANNKTMLITPPLDLSVISNPQLKFWHTQPFWSPDQDTLIIFYKTSSGGSWTQIVKYSTTIAAWQKDSITLPNPSSTYYIAFEGNAKYGYGVCVDDVSVVGTTSNSITTGTINGSPFCAGATVSIPYTITGTFLSGNVFTAQLSDASGSFSSPINIGTLSSSSNGAIAASIPLNTPTGSGYRIRVISSSPVITGSINTSSITINLTSAPTGNTAQTFCNTATVASLQATGTTIKWYSVPSGGTALSIGTTLINGNHYYASQTLNACESASRLDVTAILITPSTLYTSLQVSQTNICTGSTISLSQSGGSLGTNAVWQWYSNADFSTPIGAPTTNPNAQISFTGVITGSYFLRAEGTSTPCPAIISNNNIFVTVIVNQQPMAGSIIKSPNTSVVCAGNNVAALVTPGSGGAGTITDIVEYRYDGGLWNPYVSNTPITTTGYNSVAIRTYRTATSVGCNTSSINQTEWLISYPTNLNATNISADSAYLSWSDSNGSAWNVEYGLQGFLQGGGTTILGISSPVTTLHNLSASTNYSFYVQSNCGSPTSNWVGPFNFTTTAIPLKNLQIKVFVEGLYIGNGMMTEAKNGSIAPQWGSGIADTITVELHGAVDYSLKGRFSNVVLYTNGIANIAGINGNIYNNSYYITVFHKNSVPVTTAQAIPFNGFTNINYDFTTPANKAYGIDAQKNVGSNVFALFSGDLNQDEFYVIDGTDLSLLEPMITLGLIDYSIFDLDGSGWVDGDDLGIIEPNLTLGPFFKNPLSSKSAIPASK